MQRLEERLERLDEQTREIEAASQQPVACDQDEVWWPQLIEFFGGEDAMFVKLRINRSVFDDALVLVQDVALETRGRRGSIRSNREKLFFLVVFLSRGVEVLEVLVTAQIRTREHIIKRAKSIAMLFRPRLVGMGVRFYNEVDAEVPDAALIVDCTVCQIKRPKRPFDEAKVFFSGKHFVYAIKKEVCVNTRTGTAAMVSKGYPSSVHDITLLRDHAAALNVVLGGRSVLADLGYRGAARDVPTLVVCDQAQQALRAKRVRVECFFGRLKLLWSVFATKWRLGEECFDLFFDTACGLTNLDILRRPLNRQDRAFNEGVLVSIFIENERRRERQRLANEAYRDGRRARLGIDDE